MGWKPKNSPSFLKFLLSPDFSDNLPIPPLFVKKYLDGGEILENPLLVTYDSAKSWPVSIVQTGRKYCFKLGWSEFIKDNHLETGDFLLFWLIGRATFFVAMYSPSGIEKRKSSSPASNISTNPTFADSALITEPVDLDSETTSSEYDDGKVKEESEGMHEASTFVTPLKTPCFKVTISKTRSHRVCLPTLFVRETRILASMKIMMLINEMGREWPVKMLRRKTHYGFDLTSGWSTFRKANNIKNGDTCTFRALQNAGNKIYVKVLCSKGSKRIDGEGNEGNSRNGKDEGSAGKRGRDTYVKPLHRPSFKVSSTSDYRVNLPRGFVTETKTLAYRKNTVLKDEEGREWLVRVRPRNDSNGFDLTSGWASFRKANDIEKGDTCLFEFFQDEGNLIHVKVLNRKGRRGVRRAKRRTERPWLDKEPLQQ